MNEIIKKKREKMASQTDLRWSSVLQSDPNDVPKGYLGKASQASEKSDSETCFSDFLFPFFFLLIFSIFSHPLLLLPSSLSSFHHARVCIELGVKFMSVSSPFPFLLLFSSYSPISFFTFRLFLSLQLPYLVESPHLVR